MSAFRQFEIDALRMMATGVLSEDVLTQVLGSEEFDSYRYTGCGYFITVKSTQLPDERIALSEPPIAAISGEIQAGFVAYLGDNELTLECHTWGTVDVPADFRDREVAIQTPPVNYVDLRE